MAAQNSTLPLFDCKPKAPQPRVSVRLDGYLSEDPTTWLQPHDTLIGGGLDWAWCYVLFREIPNHHGYWIGSNGTLWSFRDNTGKAKGKCRQLVPSEMDGGHLKNHLTDDSGRRRGHYIHRLVIENFVSPRPEGLECRHRDGNPKNNNHWNLEWGTRKQNMEDRDLVHKTTARGEAYPHTSLRNEDISTMYDLCEKGMLVHEIASRFQMDSSEVCKILKGVYWSHAVPGRQPPLLGVNGRQRAWDIRKRANRGSPCV